ncbi:hypothetical protein HK101_011264, partial [Irineochytrium annulatum]
MNSLGSLARAASSSATTSPSSKRKKSSRKRKPSRANYTPVDTSDRSFAAAGIGAAKDLEAGGSNNEDDSDGSDDDLGSLASNRSESQLFVQGNAVGSSSTIMQMGTNFTRAIIDTIYATSPGPPMLAQPVSPSSLVPSILPEQVLPQEPIYGGPGGLSDTMHELSPDF